MRFEEVSFALDEYEVCDFKIIEDGAATSRGVAVGDALEDAEETYPELECDTANEGTDYVTFPYCSGRLGPRNFVWFGGDPINTIQFNSQIFGNTRNDG